MNLQSLLRIPFFYRTFTRIISGGSCPRYVKEYVRPSCKDRILDIGCGPADILGHLPAVDYTGFDANPKYIAAARKCFSNRGKFFCMNVAADAIQESEAFDIVMANGVLHHLNDEESLALLRLAHHVLKPSGRLVTLDCCYVDSQSRIARFIISKDRGKYPRTKSGYVDLASQVFGSVRAEIRNDLIRIPYTHIIMECSIVG